MPRPRPAYPPEFRRQLLALVRAGTSRSGTCRSLGASRVGLPDEAAAGIVEAEWAAASGNVPRVQY